MKRAKFWPDVAPGSTQFNYGEDTSAAAMLERFRVFSAMGVFTGLTVTPNPYDATKLDVDRGEGYTPLGERIYAAVPSSATIELVDYTEGSLNYVCARYVESTSVPLIERFDTYKSHDTFIEDSYEIEVFDQTSWASLTTTQRRDRLLLAIIEAQGEDTALTSNNIQLPTTYNAALYVSQPESITGVTTLRVSPSTIPGTGVLDYTVATKSLKWKSPRDVTFGAAVIIETDGTYTIPSRSGANYIEVSVVSGILSEEDQRDLITVQNLYAQTVPRYSSMDAHHRAMLGTGRITPTNPHGLSLDDIGGETESFIIDHQDLMHANGILRGSSTSCLRCFVINLGIDKIQIQSPVEGDIFYVNGRKLYEIQNNEVLFDDIGVGGPDQLYLIYADQSGVIDKYLRAQQPQIPTVTGVRIIGISSNVDSGSYQIAYNATNTTLTFGGGTAINVPSDGIYVLPFGVSSYAVVEVAISTLPVSDSTDTITLYEPLDEDSYLALASVVFAAAGGDLENLKDLRIFGTLAEENLRDDLIDERHSTMLQDLRSDGVVSGGEVFPNTGSNNTVDYSALIGYLNGVKLNVESGTLVLPAGSSTWYIYVNLWGEVLASSTQITSNVINLATVITTGSIITTSAITDTRVMISDLDDRLRGYSTHQGANIIGFDNSIDPTVFSTRTVQSAIEALYNAVQIAEKGLKYYRTRTFVNYGGGNNLILTPGRVNCGGDPRENSNNVIETLGSSIIESGAAALADTIYYCYAVPDLTLPAQYKLRLSLTAPDNDRLHDFSFEGYGTGRFVGSIRTNSLAQVQPFRHVNDCIFHGAQFIKEETGAVATVCSNFTGVYGRTQAGSNNFLLPETAVGVFLSIDVKSRNQGDGEWLHLRVGVGPNGNTPTPAVTEFDKIPYDAATALGFDMSAEALSDNPSSAKITTGNITNGLCSLDGSQNVYAAAAYVASALGSGSDVRITLWVDGWKEQLD